MEPLIEPPEDIAHDCMMQALAKSNGENFRDNAEKRIAAALRRAYEEGAKRERERLIDVARNLVPRISDVGHSYDDHDDERNTQIEIWVKDAHYVGAMQTRFQIVKAMSATPTETLQTKKDS